MFRRFPSALIPKVGIHLSKSPPEPPNPLSGYAIGGHPIRVNRMVKAESSAVAEFLCRCAADNEPSCRSLGIKFDDLLPYIVDRTLSSLDDGFSVVARADDRIVGISLAYLVLTEGSKCSRGEIAQFPFDLGTSIDALQRRYGSRDVCRVAAPFEEMNSISLKFVPKRIRQFLSIGFGCVDPTAKGHYLMQKLVHKQCVLAHSEGIKFALTQISAPSGLEEIGFHKVFAVDYSSFRDHGRLIHERAPMPCGATELQLAAANLDETIRRRCGEEN